MPRLELILNATHLDIPQIRTCLLGTPRRAAVLLPHESPLAEGDFGADVYEDTDLVPTSSSLEERIYLEAAEHRRQLAEALQNCHLFDLPWGEDISKVLGIPYERTKVLATAARQLFERGCDRVFLVLQGYALSQLALLQEGERCGLVGAETSPWFCQAGESIVRHPALIQEPYIPELHRMLSEKPQTEDSQKEQRHRIFSRFRGGVLVLLPSAESLYAQNAARVVQALAKHNIPSCVLTDLPAAQLVHRNLGAEVNLLVPPDDSGADQPRVLADATTRLLRRLQELATEQLSIAAPSGVESLGQCLLDWMDLFAVNADSFSIVFAHALKVERLHFVLNAMRPRTVYKVPAGTTVLDAAHRYLSTLFGALSVSSVFASVDESTRNWDVSPCDRVTLLGEEQVRAFGKRGWERKRLVMAGQPELDDAARQWSVERSRAEVQRVVPEYDISRGTILIATSGLDRQGENGWIKAIGECAERLDRQVIIKVHPSFAMDAYLKLPNSQPTLPVIVCRDIPLYPLLALAELVVTDASHAGKLAIYFDKPLLAVNLTGLPFPYNRFDEDGVAPLARNLQQVKELVESYFASEENWQRYLDRYGWYVMQHFTSRDGRAAERIAELLAHPTQNVEDTTARHSR